MGDVGTGPISRTEQKISLVIDSLVVVRTMVSSVYAKKARGVYRAHLLAPKYTSASARRRQPSRTTLDSRVSTDDDTTFRSHVLTSRTPTPHAVHTVTLSSRDSRDHLSAQIPQVSRPAGLHVTLDVTRHVLFVCSSGAALHVVVVGSGSARGASTLVPRFCVLVAGACMALRQQRAHSVQTPTLDEFSRWN